VVILKARNFRSVKGVPYTRLEYIHGVPQSRITRFNMGTWKEDFDYLIELKANETVYMRDIALESLRVNVNRHLHKKIGTQNYYFTVVVYPHHILRENKMMTGAGADRLQEGMRRAFGKPVGRAAAIKKGQTIAKIFTYANYVDIAKNALKIGASKVPKGAYIYVSRRE